MTDEIVIGGDMEDIPEGTYSAVVQSIDTKTSDSFGDFRAWDFRLASGSVVGGASSMSTSKKSKGGRWIRAILGREVVKGESVKEQLIGRPCTVSVIDKDGWPAVGDVLPPMAMATPGVTVAALSVVPAAPGEIGELP